MRKIIDELYMTINQDLGQEWLVQFSSKIYKEKCGFMKIPKVVRKETDNFYFIGAAHYMFIFDDNGKTGTFIALLRDELFAPDKEKEYKEEIDGFRNRILNVNDEFINSVREKMT